MALQVQEIPTKLRSSQICKSGKDQRSKTWQLHRHEAGRQFHRYPQRQWSVLRSGQHLSPCWWAFTRRSARRWRCHLPNSSMEVRCQNGQVHLAREMRACHLSGQG